MAYHRGSLPERLVTETRRLLAHRAPADLSIREVARALGVSANAPYRHFPDREALLGAVAAAGYRSTAEALAGRVGSTAVAEAWSALAAAEPALAELMTDRLAGGADPALQEAVAEWLGEVSRAVEEEADRDDPESVIRAAVACWASVVGMSRLRRSGVLAGLDHWMLPDERVLARRAAAS